MLSQESLTQCDGGVPHFDLLVWGVHLPSSTFPCGTEQKHNEPQSLEFLVTKISACFTQGLRACGQCAETPLLLPWQPQGLCLPLPSAMEGWLHGSPRMCIIFALPQPQQGPAATSTCRLLVSDAHQASNSFCSFTLALSMSSCRCSISTFRAFRRVNIVLYLQGHQAGALRVSGRREGCRLQDLCLRASQCCAGNRTGTLMLPPEARVWCQGSHPS